MTITAYNIKDDFKLPNPFTKNRLSGLPKLIIGDDILVKSEYENLREVSNRGDNLNTSNEYAGDFSKIKDVHFLKGSYFDRDYFRRLFPSINIRNKPDAADVIIYDDKSVFENDITPSVYYKTVIPNGDTVYYQRSTCTSTLCDLLHNNVSYNYRTYSPLVTISENATILRSILNSIWKSEKAVYLGEENSYYNLLNSLNKFYMKTSDALTKIPSSLKQNNLSLSDCITYFEQIGTGSEQIMKTAIESVIMYNSDKYLPIQVFMYYCLNIQETKILKNSPKLISNKLTLFINSHRDYLISTYNNSEFIQLISDFSRVCSNMANKYKNIDWDLVSKFINSSEVFNKLNRYDTEAVSVQGINFTFNFGPLATPKEENLIETKSEFIL